MEYNNKINTKFQEIESSSTVYCLFDSPYTCFEVSKYFKSKPRGYYTSLHIPELNNVQQILDKLEEYE